MRLRVLDLDGAVTAQKGLLRRHAPEVLDLADWGPRLRMTCRFGAFRRFQQRLAELAGDDGGPMLNFLGSGDFHHVTLALIRRIRGPFNLLVIDKHPDWVRGVPVLHCGTWLSHALRLPNLRRVVHAGGDLDFDNLYRLLAPWGELHSGRVTVLPARRLYCKGRWPGIPHAPLLGGGPIAEVLEEALRPALGDLGEIPLYVSLDKDALGAAEAVVNWDSGSLGAGEVRDVLDWFIAACGGRFAGMDVVGDWSPVRLHWGLRTLCHWSEHPRLHVNPAAATRINQGYNLALVDHLLGRSGAARERDIRRPTVDAPRRGRYRNSFPEIHTPTATVVRG
jgi:hypothetical protein